MNAKRKLLAVVAVIVVPVLLVALIGQVTDLAHSGNGRLDLYFPRVPSAPRPVIMWIHGGGYIGGRKEAIQAYGMALANEGYVVANMEYAVAPGQKYPGPVVQANAALQYLQVHVAEYGGDKTRLYIGGDSAGAQIASQVAAVVTNADLARLMSISPAAEPRQLKGVLLYCGAYDFTTVKLDHEYQFNLDTAPAQQAFIEAVAFLNRHS